MKIAVIGAGPIGCYVISCLARSTDHELYLLGRSTCAAIAHAGILVEDKVTLETYRIDPGRFHIESDIKKIPACDVIILAVKAHQISDLLGHLRSLCLPSTVVVTLQNGWNFEEKIQAAIPENPLYSGTCWIRMSAAGSTDGHPYAIRHDFGSVIQLGCYQGKGAPKFSAEGEAILQALFKPSGSDLELVANPQSAQLAKLALNVPLCILMVKHACSVSEIFALHDEEYMALQKEMIEAAEKAGFPVAPAHIAEYVEHFRKMPLAPPTGSRKEHAAEVRKALPTAWALLDDMEKRRIAMPILEGYRRELDHSDEPAPSFCFKR